MPKWNETLKLNSKYSQGRITENLLQNPDKFLNPKKIMIYRSSYEQKFALWLDKNPCVEFWSSEILSIPYFNPFKNKICRYFPDFVAKINQKIYIIEIKPSNKLKKPEATKWKQMKEYKINLSKFQSADKYCKEKGYIFKIITEKHLIL